MTKFQPADIFFDPVIVGTSPSPIRGQNQRQEERKPKFKETTMTKLFATAALIAASIAIVPAAQARIAFNGVAAGMTVIPAVHGRLAANGVKAGSGTATTVRVVYVQLPRR